MNNGVIEQAGAPRDVFNNPQTAFVARFIGGHNVLATDAGPIAVRADRLVLRRPIPNINGRVDGVVRSVEYQGTYVQLAIEGKDGREITATTTEDTFDLTPFSPGDPISVSWGERDVHHLSQAA